MATMTTREAGERLGIRSASVVRAIQRRKLAAEKRGRDYFIDSREVERYAQTLGRKSGK